MCCILLCACWQEVIKQYAVQFGAVVEETVPAVLPRTGKRAQCHSCQLHVLIVCPGAAAGEAAEDAQRALQAALLSFAGKPVAELVSFDLGAKLTELGLAQFCPAEACLERVAPVCV
jgi:hypothetical protein